MAEIEEKPCYMTLYAEDWEVRSDCCERGPNKTIWCGKDILGSIKDKNYHFRGILRASYQTSPLSLDMVYIHMQHFPTTALGVFNIDIELQQAERFCTQLRTAIDRVKEMRKRIGLD